MKALALSGIRQLKLVDKEKPSLQNEDDVLVRIRSVGICGSDIHYYNEGNIGSQIVEYPWIVGHEASGDVVAVGAAVRQVVVGDRIAIEPTLWCGECEQCLQGRKHTCLNQRFLGCPGQMEGCTSEYFVLPEKCCFKVAAHLSYELAVFAEPLSVGVYAVEMYDLDLEDKNVGILGAGPIGQSVLASVVKKNGANIFVSDKINGRLDLARKMGATWTGNPDQGNVVEDVKMVEPQLLDVVFECCGKQETVDQAIDLLKPGGTLLMIGIPEVDRISFKIDQMRRKEIRFLNVRRQNECFQKAIDLIESDPVYFQNLITHKFKLDSAFEGYELVRQYKDSVLKAVIEP